MKNTLNENLLMIIPKWSTNFNTSVKNQARTDKYQFIQNSSIGINRIDTMLRSPGCPFALYVGKKKLVKRKEFEEFIHNQVDI